MGSSCIGRNRSGTGSLRAGCICGHQIGDMFSAVNVPGFDVKQDTARPVLPEIDTCPPPELDPSLGGIIHHEKKGFRVLGKVSKRDILLVARIIEEHQRAGIKNLKEPGWSATMLDVRLTIAAGGPEIDRTAAFDKPSQFRRQVIFSSGPMLLAVPSEGGCRGVPALPSPQG